MHDSPASTLDVLGLVRERYAQGARGPVPELCCLVDYDTALLAALPRARPPCCPEE